jgi:hypothetical protein
MLAHIDVFPLTAKQANYLGNILNLHGDSADMQKFQPFLRNSIWGLNQYRSKDMQYGIENEDQARSDYLKFMRSSVPETIVSDSSWCYFDGMDIRNTMSCLIQ